MAGAGGAAKKADTEAGSIKRKRGVFCRDLRPMMYGFGDDPAPLPETVDLVEDAVLDYVTDVMHKALEAAMKKSNGDVKKARLAIEDILYLVRKDPPKFARVQELLRMNEELKKARKAFDLEEEAVSKDAAGAGGGGKGGGKGGAAGGGGGAPKKSHKKKVPPKDPSSGAGGSAKPAGAK